MSCYTLGIDTSNYATSLAVFDTAGEVVCAKKRFLPVKEGQLGLRQSDALFHHTTALPEMLEELSREFDLTQIAAVGVSQKPRPVEGSYMPCFLAGVSAATAFARARGIPLVHTTHQQGHAAAALFAAKGEELFRQKVLLFHISGGTTDLLLCDEDLQEDGRFKMNPPLRGREDREALRQAVADGTIEVIATDHAPHTAEQKSRGLAGSAMGIVGLECAFPLLYTYLVKPGLLTLEQLVERMSMAPRRIFGLGGGLQAGEPADLTVFDLDAEYEIDPETFLSKGRATPFAGWRVAGRTLWTLVGGRTAYATERFR